MLRRVLLSGTILLALLLDRAAYYGVRAMGFQYLMHTFSMTGEHVSSVWRVLSIVSMLAPVAGAVLAAIVPARWVAVAGAVLAMLGYALLAAAGSQVTALAAFGVVAVGGGLFRPTLLAAAAEVFLAEQANASFFCFLYAAVNVGAMSSAGTAAIQATGIAPQNTVFVTAAVVAGVVVVLALAAALLPHFLREERSPVPLEPRRAMLVAAAIALGIVFTLTAGAVDQFAFYPALDHATASNLAWIYMVNPSVVLSAATLTGLVLGSLSFARIRVPLAFVIALGLLFTSLAAVVGMAAPSQIGVAAGLMSISGLGEGFVTPILLAVVARGLPWRAQTAAIAGWMVITEAAGWGVSLVPAQNAVVGRLVLGFVAFLALVSAIAVAAMFRAFARALEPESGSIETDAAPDPGGAGLSAG